jgi:hypothetical protein
VQALQLTLAVVLGGKAVAAALILNSPNTTHNSADGKGDTAEIELLVHNDCKGKRCQSDTRFNFDETGQQMNSQTVEEKDEWEFMFILHQQIQLIRKRGRLIQTTLMCLILCILFMVGVQMMSLLIISRLSQCDRWGQLVLMRVLGFNLCDCWFWSFPPKFYIHRYLDFFTWNGVSVFWPGSCFDGDSNGTSTCCVRV